MVVVVVVVVGVLWEGVVGSARELARMSLVVVLLLVEFADVPNEFTTAAVLLVVELLAVILLTEGCRVGLAVVGGVVSPPPLPRAEGPPLDSVAMVAI